MRDIVDESAAKCMEAGHPVQVCVDTEIAPFCKALQKNKQEASCASLQSNALATPS